MEESGSAKLKLSQGGKLKRQLIIRDICSPHSLSDLKLFDDILHQTMDTEIPANMIKLFWQNVDRGSGAHF